MPRRCVSACSEEREHGAVDVYLQCSGGEDVSAYVEFAEGVGSGTAGGEEEGWVNVGLCDEVAELGCHYCVLRWFV